MVAAFYGKPAQHSYFGSCSNGGRQALMEGQRFPNDCDGISLAHGRREPRGELRMRGSEPLMFAAI